MVDAPRIFGLGGPPWVGKREVTRRFAALYGHLFPGGVIYVDCQSSGADLADVRAVLADALDRRSSAALLAELADAHVLRREPGDAYSFANRLVRLHARERAEDEARNGELKRPRGW